MNFKLETSALLPAMTETHNCPHCPARLATVQGLRSHLTQSQRCHARHRASFIDSDSSDDQLQDDNQNAENLPPEGIPIDYDSDFGSLPCVDPEPMVDTSESLEEQDELRSRSPWSKRASVEDVEDEDNQTAEPRFIEDFPRPAGLPLSPEKTTSSAFEAHRELQREAGDAPWAPFESEGEWELARWLMTSGVSQTKIDSFLKLDKVRQRLIP